MENASRALIMAGGILLGILILSLMAILILSAQDFSGNYEETKKSEAMQQFNVNFTKYLGQDLSIHEVVTISNFAKKNGVSITSGEKTSMQIKDDVEDYSKEEDSIQKYKLIINSYSNNGYVNSIRFIEK